MLLFLACVLFLPVISFGQEQYRDVADAISKLINVQEKYIGSLKKAAKAEEAALAMRELNAQLGELNSLFKELNKKYPTFSVVDSKISPELKVLIASSEKLSGQLTETTIINLYRYGNEEAVAAEISKMKELLRSITSFTEEKIETQKK